MKEQLAKLSETLNLPKGTYSLSEYQPEMVKEKLNNLRGQNRKCMRIAGMGMMYPDCISYRLIIGNDTIIFDSTEKIKESFTPLRTAAEALSYAQIVTDYTYEDDFSGWKELLQKEKKVYEKKKKAAQRQIRKGTKDDKWDFGYWYCLNPSLETSYINKVPEGWEILLYKKIDERYETYYTRKKLLVTPNGEIEDIAYDLVFKYDYDPRLQWD